ncbi:MAG TPA: NAD(P)H-binding protein [Blastocatellia bacterium]|nr:NAD(P)H-binding protein [Blastocatellia bacterium]
MPQQNVIVTGATGYIGRRLIPELIKRGHAVRALVRRGSETRAPQGCETVVGDPLDGLSLTQLFRAGDTVVQLVGVPHPSPAKAPQFRSIDLASALAAVKAAAETGVAHFVYVSVAHPAPVMKAYIEARSEAERAIRNSRLNATILRPWYVLGPGHRWPYALVPLYWILEKIHATRETARRLGLITLDQMAAALAWSVDSPAPGVRILDVTDIRRRSQT